MGDEVARSGRPVVLKTLIMYILRPNTTRIAFAVDWLQSTIQTLAVYGHCTHLCLSCWGGALVGVEVGRSGGPVVLKTTIMYICKASRL